jgi:hypothetical protein
VEIYLTDDVLGWLDALLAADPDSHRQIVYAVEALAEAGPNLGRPLVDRVKARRSTTSRSCDPALRAGRRSACYSPSTPGAARSCWWPVTRPETGKGWYRTAILRAEERYAIYVKERAEEEGTP